MSDPRIVLVRDDATGIARITINNPERRNCYDPPMREQLGAYLDDLAIYGGTDEIQRNIIAERSLGLLREQLPGRGEPYGEFLRSISRGE